MPLDAPFRLGPFTVDEVGRLMPCTPADFPTFCVLWRGLTVRVELTVRAMAAPEGLLALGMALGRVPSSADPAAMPRGQVLDMLHDLATRLPAGWKLDLLADHRVGLKAARALAVPTTVTALVSEVALFLLALSPYLDVLGETGLGTGGAAGTANTWPG
ncbi:hypothetical protein [Limobrevibacterium gyesilva]|uniref:Uncharacterized protein n=1 Tax=Limobrevibacterium gyesilva TaxID=2991712 RepID=A0AA41YN05_9PROT|nr:hypothetical protein [Limobrevibacterium gyesilva]MCW3476499.1 hypothetical protein [Limobrevibacterium gyesilva]